MTVLGKSEIINKGVPIKIKYNLMGHPLESYFREHSQVADFWINLPQSTDTLQLTQDLVVVNENGSLFLEFSITLEVVKRSHDQCGILIDFLEGNCHLILRQVIFDPDVDVSEQWAFEVSYD